MNDPMPPYPTPPDMMPPAPSRQPRRNPRKKMILLIIIIGVILLIGVIGAAAYWFFVRHPKPASPTAGTTNQQVSPPASSSNTTPGSTTIQQYISKGSDLNLSFMYPSDWTVTPASGGNTDDQAITITSPAVSMLDTTGAAITGKIVATIRPANAQVSELTSGKATVALDSTQFAYSKPTSSQHQYPYLTFVNLSGGQDTAGDFDEVIITGVSKFNKGQSLTTESLGQLDPIISAQFYQCSTSACTGTGATPLSISSSSWQNTAIFQQIQTLLASLQLN